VLSCTPRMKAAGVGRGGPSSTPTTNPGRCMLGLGPSTSRGFEAARLGVLSLRLSAPLRSGTGGGERSWTRADRSVTNVRARSSRMTAPICRSRSGHVVSSSTLRSGQARSGEAGEAGGGRTAGGGKWLCLCCADELCTWVGGVPQAGAWVGGVLRIGVGGSRLAVFSSSAFFRRRVLTR